MNKELINLSKLNKLIVKKGTNNRLLKIYVDYALTSSVYGLAYNKALTDLLTESGIKVEECKEEDKIKLIQNDTAYEVNITKCDTSSGNRRFIDFDTLVKL